MIRGSYLRSLEVGALSTREAFEAFLSSFSVDFFYIVESDFFNAISLVSWLIIPVGIAFHCSEWSDSFLSYSCFFLSCIEKA